MSSSGVAGEVGDLVSSAHGRVMRKAKFLMEMDARAPWQALCNWLSDTDTAVESPILISLN